MKVFSEIATNGLKMVSAVTSFASTCVQAIIVLCCSIGAFVIAAFVMPSRPFFCNILGRLFLLEEHKKHYWEIVSFLDGRSDDRAQEVSLRVTSLAATFRVQGDVQLQRYGKTSLHRLFFQGEKIVVEDGTGRRIRGDAIWGVIPLPDGADGIQDWDITSKYVCSTNNSRNRGVAFGIGFEQNATGFTYIQVTVKEKNGQSAEGERFLADLHVAKDKAIPPAVL